MEEFHVLPHVNTIFFNNSAILLDLRKNAYYTLNDTAADFWKIFLQTNSYEQTIKEMSELYGHDYEAVKTDIDELINDLKKAKLIEIVMPRKTN